MSQAVAAVALSTPCYWIRLREVICSEAVGDDNSADLQRQSKFRP